MEFCIEGDMGRVIDNAAGERAGDRAQASLGRRLRAETVLPGDPAYDEARKVWNGMVDRKPAAIAYCACAKDVIEAVGVARAQGLLLSVRAGGHNFAGYGVCDGGLVVDLSRIKGVAVDPERRRVRAGAGLRIGELDAATQRFGLATTMGVNSDTGIAGLTLGGGFGRLGRKHGLACDNLVAAQVVTADGRLLRASAAENADLFWGLRGGGGNFGIVTEFEYRLHPVGPEVLKAALAYDYRHAREALRAYQAFAAAAPDEVSADAALVRSPSGEPMFGVSICHIGAIEQDGLEALLRPLRAQATPVDEQIATMPYLEVQAAGDTLFPTGSRYYCKAQFLRELGDAAIEAMLEQFAAAPSQRSIAVLQQVGGAIARVPLTATAYVNRDAAYDCFPIAIWDDPAGDEANTTWARAFQAAMSRFSTGGVYVNNLGDEGTGRIRAAYGANYTRLAALKQEYDPSNLFRMNQNIVPGG